jgi:hypothetical protein
MATRKRRRDPRIVPPIDEFERAYPEFIGPVGPPLELWLMAHKAERDRTIATNLRSGADADDECEPGENEASP